MPVFDLPTTPLDCLGEPWPEGQSQLMILEDQINMWNYRNPLRPVSYFPLLPTPKENTTHD